MGIWIGDWDESVPAWRRFGQCVLTVVVLLGLGLCIQTYSEDEVSHSIKVRFPLFFGAEWLIDRTADYDPKTARWGAVNRAVMVEDGEVVFVRSGKVVYAVKMLRQTLGPELGEYAYLTVGTDAPIVHGTTDNFPGGLIFPGLTIPWSGHEKGKGYWYVGKRFRSIGVQSCEIGVPFFNGDLESYRSAVPASVHFENVPWKIEAASRRGSGSSLK